MKKLINEKELKNLKRYKDFHVCIVKVNEFSESYLNGFNRDKMKFLYRVLYSDTKLSLEDHNWGKYFVILYSKNMQKIVASDNMSQELLENICNYSSFNQMQKIDFTKINESAKIEELVSKVDPIISKMKIIVDK